MASIEVSWSTPHLTLTVMACMSDDCDDDDPDVGAALG